VTNITLAGNVTGQQLRRIVLHVVDRLADGRINAAASSGEPFIQVSTSSSSNTHGIRSWSCAANALRAVVTTVSLCPC
jgi:hypothetical protein